MLEEGPDQRQEMLGLFTLEESVTYGGKLRQVGNKRKKLDIQRCESESSQTT